MTTPDAELRHKRSQRRGQRSQLQRLMQKAENLAQQIPLSFDELQGTMTSMDKTNSALQELDNYVTNSLTTEDTIDAEIKESGDIQNAYDIVASKVRSALAGAERYPESSHHSLTTVHRTPASFPTRQFPKLPQLELPKFAGDPLQWTTFWDSYESAIHTSNMPSVDKFNYLKSLLKGVAADAISGISVTNGTYDTAIALITQRFGQKQLIINAHVESLIIIHRSNSDTVSLRKLHDLVEIHIRGLESVGITATTYGTILTPIILSKLPADIRLILTRKHGSAVGDLNILRELLKIEIEARELSKECKLQSTPSQVQSDFTTGALVNPAQSDVCVFCKSTGHSTFFCRTVVSPSARRAKVIEEKRCFNCLRQDHTVKFCPITRYCQKCGFRHHTSLCTKTINPRQTTHTRTSRGHFLQTDNSRNRQLNHAHGHGHGQFTRNATATHLTHNPELTHHAQLTDNCSHFPNNDSNLSPALLSTSGSILMQTALANIKDRNGTLHAVRLLFDTGSQRSYVSSRVIRELGIKPSTTETLAISPFGQRSSTTKSYNVASLTCFSRHNSLSHSIVAVVVPTITHPIMRSPLHQSFKTCFSKLLLADPPSATEESLQIDILVGLDYYWDMVKDEVLRIADCSLTAIPSSFGYLVSGRSKSQSSSTFNALFVGISSPTSSDFVKEFWESESFDVQGAEIHKNVEPDPVLLQFEDSIQKVDGRYIVRLPWKEDVPKLPSNQRLARNRFNSLVRRLQGTELMSSYDEIIQQQLRSNFIEPVDESATPEGTIHYISHHPVIRPERETTKIRIVYDASAKLSSQHNCLNDCLHSGPNLLTDIHRLLLQFRTYPIVVLADIEKAFLQIGLCPVDRDATRFFWLRDYTKSFEPGNVQVFRFCRVPFGATSSPFLLAATLRHHFNASSNALVKSLVPHLYVDNLSTGVATVNEAKELYSVAKESIRDAGMNLRQFISNSDEFINWIPPDDRSKSTLVKVLGVPWQVKEDLLSCKSIPEVNQTSEVVTKRRILQVVSKVFDPMGVLSPVVIKAKIFIQDLWIDGLDWDKKVSSTFLHKWKVIIQELCLLSEITVNRLVPLNKPAELHIFVDASMRAYGAVAGSGSVGSVSMHFLCSKSRVSPVKKVTIPRLELIAALMGCKLADFVSNSIPELSNNINVWSDSQVVLHWIKGSQKKVDVFVQNRVTQIRKYSYNFTYCCTSENPADLCSRGCSINDLKINQLWWKGPSWLSKPKSEWPQYTNCPKFKIEDSSEPIPSVALQVQLVRVYKDTPFEIDLYRYSSLDKLFRVTAYCIRFVKHLRTGHPRPSNLTVTSEELEQSKKLWLKWTQNSTYQKEFSLLQRGQTSVTIKELGLFIHDGILRCRGRFQNAKVSSAFQNPILLPKNHYFTDLVIMKCHTKMMHQGVRHTLTALRRHFWIPSGRQQLKKILNKCMVCRHWEGPSFSIPAMPPLPTSRVSESPPFSSTGCDFAGPVQVFDPGISSKTYICIFTCAVTRAVHLELVGDMTTGTFILALRRFISRRGVPAQIISDNAKTFKLAKTVMERLWHNIVISPETTSYIASNGIKWTFIVERAPWWGGFYERMVGLVKRTLVKAAGKSKLSTVQLTTILAEIEAILNSRPLTYVYGDNRDGQPLTPNCFLMPSFAGIPTADIDTDPDYINASATILINKLRDTQRVLDYYWSIWRSEYLSQLREYHLRWGKASKSCTRIPSVGDVVLVKEDGAKRGLWKLAVIKQVYHGSDGCIRSAQLKCKDTILQRPVSKLYPLEITSDIATIPEADTTQRQQRQSALKAKTQIKECLKIEDG